MDFESRVAVDSAVLGVALTPAELEAWDLHLTQDDEAYLNDVMAGKYERLADTAIGKAGDALVAGSVGEAVHTSFAADLPSEFKNISSLLMDLDGSGEGGAGAA